MRSLAPPGSTSRIRWLPGGRTRRRSRPVPTRSTAAGSTRFGSAAREPTSPWVSSRERAGSARRSRRRRGSSTSRTCRRRRSSRRPIGVVRRASCARRSRSSPEGRGCPGSRSVSKAGRIVDATATVGAEIVRAQLAADEQAPFLGEVALVDGSSPVKQTGLVFCDTLYDENATCHIAYGAGIAGVLRRRRSRRTSCSREA